MTSREEEIELVTQALKKILCKYPNWRAGQAICNVAMWVKGPVSSAAWDVDDSELIIEIEKHLNSDKRA